MNDFTDKIDNVRKNVVELKKIYNHYIGNLTNSNLTVSRAIYDDLVINQTRNRSENNTKNNPLETQREKVIPKSNVTPNPNINFAYATTN